MNDIKITKFNSRINLYLIMFRERERYGFKLSFPRRSHRTPTREGKLAFGCSLFVGKFIKKDKKKFNCYFCDQNCGSRLKYYEQCYGENVFTIILSRQVFISYYLDPPLSVFYYLIFTVWHI